MTIYLLLLAIIIISAGGFIALFTGSLYKGATWTGAGSAILGALTALSSGCWALFCGHHASIHMMWQIPFGSFYIGLDPLSAFFVITISIVCAVSAIYGAGYLASYKGKKNIGAAWCFYNLLFASMLLVIVARNGILFLIAWEIMSIASFFLVMFEHEKKKTRHAGWVYLVAAHAGQACLMFLFIMLAGDSSSLDFDTFSAAAGKSTLFIIALIGFGAKAGLMPLHVWLPDAHPAAPSHVSAVMSGAMIKTGIYGIIRILSLVGTPALWWAYTLIIAGAVSGVIGVLFAIAQHDIKRLLAFSSVENIGIIAMGLGLWLLGVSFNAPAIAVFGLMGGLLHVLNHAVFKSLLFFGAGAVARETGTGNIDLLGGLIKRMPGTALAFGIGSVALCGLPPLSGFISELLIYLSSFNALTSKASGQTIMGGLIAIIALSLIGGLAVTCFIKVFGIVFLGEPRSEKVAKASEANHPMLTAMAIASALCIFIGLFSPAALKLILPVAAQLAGTENISASYEAASRIMLKISLAGFLFIILAGFFWWMRRRLLKEKVNRKAPSWDCGYLLPSSRMQYTASSFSWPVINMFRWIIRPGRNVEITKGFFPFKGKVSTQTDDIFRKGLFDTLFRFTEEVAQKIHMLQEGRNQLYVLYIAITVLILLLVKLR